MATILTLAAMSAQSKTGSISGVVKDAGTGTPIVDATVSVFTRVQYVGDTMMTSDQTKKVQSVTDADGHYVLPDLFGSLYGVTVTLPPPNVRFVQKRVNLRAGEDLSTVDFLIVMDGSISGRVLDQNKEPVPRANVYLLSAEYGVNGTGYFGKKQAITDDKGDYKISAEAGVPYLMLASRRSPFDLNSDAPDNPKLRKPTYVPTFFGNVTEPLGAPSIVLQSGEKREAIDITMQRRASLCIEGRVDTEAGWSGGRLMVNGPEITGGTSSSGGLGMSPQSGTLPPDRKFRLCGLRPADYRLMVMIPDPKNADNSPLFGVGQVNVGDRDVADVRIYAGPGLTIPGSVVFDGKPPDPLPTTKVTVALTNLERIYTQGERGGSARVSIPSEFEMKDVLRGTYSARVLLNAPGLYLKDLQYADQSVMTAPIRVGGTSGSPSFRVVIGQNGGTISIKVADKDGKPVPNSTVVVVPADATPELQMALQMFTLETDQDGAVTTRVLAPGKYLLLATTRKIDRSLDNAGRVWRSRSHAKEISLEENGKLEVTLEARPL